MSQTLSTYLPAGINLAGFGAYLSPFTVTASGTIQTAGNDGVYSALSNPSLANYGRIAGAADGVHFVSGGAVENLGTASVISGATEAVVIGGSSGYLLNQGAITGASFIDVSIGSTSGTIVNEGLVSGSGTGLAVQYGIVRNNGLVSAAEGIKLLSSGTVVNAGTVLAQSFGISAYGTVLNMGTVSAQSIGILLGNAGIVVNQGTVYGSTAVTLQDGGTLLNRGIISGSGQAVAVGNGGTILNSGTIAAQGGSAVYMSGNTATRLIVEPGAVFIGGVVGSPQASNVLELAGTTASIGTLTGIGSQFTGFSTIAFDPGATWSLAGNLAGLTSGQTITGFTSGDTIDLTNFAATSVTSIAGAGLELSDNGGLIPIDFAGITLAQNLAVRPDGAVGTDITFLLNTLSTSLGNGISLTAYGAYGAPFTITPTGTISAPSGAGVYTTLAGAYLANHGSIVALTGVELKAGGFVTNATDAGISATGFGVEINDPGTVTNAGDISSANAGVLLNAGGTVTNSGTLAGYDAVVAQGNPATVINRGLINALADGAGVERAIWLRAGGTVLNSGTIASPTNAVPAVLFQAGAANRLIADPGAVIIGGVQAIGGSNVLELAAGAPAGTLTGLGSQFTGFDTIAFDPGATWSLAGDIAGLASGQTITGFASGDTIDVTNFAATSATYISGIGLELSSAASTINIGISGSAYSQYISIAPDGTAGTDISFLASTQTLSTAIDHGITLTAAGHYLSPFTITPTGSIRQNIHAANPGVLSRDPGATLLNQGTIVADVQGVILYAQGYVSNAANAEIAGHLTAVFTYDFGTVANAGTMSGGIGTGVFLNAGGLLTNSGGGATIIAYQPVSSPDPANIINRGGLIVSDSQLNFDSAISLNSGGTILNSGTIESPDLAIVFGTAGTDLLIADPGAVFMGSVLAKGSVSTLELASASTTGTLSGIGSQFTGFHTIAFDPGAAWTLSGDAAGLASGQIITGFAGTDTIDVTNFAATGETFVPGTGLELTAAAGTLTLDLSGNISPGALTLTPDGNGGTDITMPSTHTLSTSLSQGIYLTASGRYLSPFTITPTGSINTPHGPGVYSTLAGVSLTNQGSIDALNGIILPASGEIVNAANASIFATTTGIFLNSDGTLTNAGIIRSLGFGVDVSAYATITNSGTIYGLLGVISAGPGATIYNSGGLFAMGSNRSPIAVDLPGGGTVINSGTIGISDIGQAVLFVAGAHNRLVADPGAVFIGYVVAISGSNTLELGSASTTGSLSGIGSQFTGFNIIAFDPGAAWTLSGDAAGLASGQIITGFAGTDTIDVTNFAATGETFVPGTGLELTAAAGTLTLDLIGNIYPGALTLTPDGNGGTDITMPSTHTLSTSISQGIYLTAAGHYLSPFTITPTGSINTPHGPGVYSTLAGISLTNQGSISGSAGVFFDAISTLANTGTIYGKIGGIYLRAGGAITNTGATISAYYNAINASGPATIVNDGGLINGTNTTGRGGPAIELGLGSTVINDGTIASGNGRDIGFYGSNGANRLIADPGAVFIGYVGAFGGSNALELGAGATTGTLGGIGSQFNGFNTIAFDPGAAWTLSGDAAGLASGQTITGFSAGDTIDLTGFTATSYSVGAAGLTLSNGVTSETLGIAGIAHASITGDGSTGTDITTSVACFVRGTRIATPRGNIAVEKLSVGDLVKTMHGEQPIRWIGRRAYAARFIAGNPDALPIRIRRHAIAPNIPSRDLYVSPDHAILEGGVLIHAHLLQNGISIHQPERNTDVEYFHLEFDTHTILFAENFSVESFIDEGAGHRFQNSHTRIPTLKPQTPCLPRVFEGFHLHNIKSRIAARAGISPPTQLGALIGTIDACTPTLIRGWAQNSAAPEHPVTLEIISGGFSRTILANSYRPDLRAHGLGTGCHGFALPLPNLAGPITIRRLPDGATLHGVGRISAA